MLIFVFWVVAPCDYIFDINGLKPKLIKIVLEKSARTSKRTPHFAITKIVWLMLFEGIYLCTLRIIRKNTLAKSKELLIILSRQYMHLPLDFKGY
jgi:hypothetical protein